MKFCLNMKCGYVYIHLYIDRTCLVQYIHCGITFTILYCAALNCIACICVWHGVLSIAY